MAYVITINWPRKQLVYQLPPTTLINMLTGLGVMKVGFWHISMRGLFRGMSFEEICFEDKLEKLNLFVLS